MSSKLSSKLGLALSSALAPEQKSALKLKWISRRELLALRPERKAGLLLGPKVPI